MIFVGLSLNFFLIDLQGSFAASFYLHGLLASSISSLEVVMIAVELCFEISPHLFYL